MFFWKLKILLAYNFKLFINYKSLITISSPYFQERIINCLLLISLSDPVVIGLSVQAN